MPLVFLSPMYCEHGRDRDDCTDCRFVSDFEGGRVELVESPEPVYAEHDTYLDHGGGKLTYIRRGHAIPRSLVGLPRIAANTDEVV